MTVPDDTERPAGTGPVADDRKAGMVALVGRANVGKSSLSNAMLGEKLSIVSPVAQTTRNIIRGILTEPRGQLVLIDTPGLHRAPGDLGRVMNKVARTSVEGTDCILLVLDASAPPFDEDTGWMRRAMRQDIPVVIALNKMDLGGRYERDYRAAWDETAADLDDITVREPTWIKVSAETGKGVQELTDLLFGFLPVGPLLYPEDMLSDYPRKLNIADVVREKMFYELRDELPHAVAVWVESIDEGEEKWAVRVLIYVNRHSQKGIIIGEKGRAIRKVRRLAESELKQIYDHPVKLDLYVKVEKNWGRNFWLLKKFGYVN